MRVEISKEAQQDLQEIWLFTYRKWSQEQADRYFNLLMDEIEFLALYPHDGKDYSQIRKGYFRAKVKSHFIFYRINGHKSCIEIVRILHEKMDVKSKLL